METTDLDRWHIEDEVLHDCRKCTNPRIFIMKITEILKNSVKQIN